MPSQHKYPPVSVRLPEPDRRWLLEHAKTTGRPVNAVMVTAVAAYRKQTQASDCCGAPCYSVPAGGIACRDCGNGCTEKGPRMNAKTDREAGPPDAGQALPR
jgi:hypothetical protein